MKQEIRKKDIAIIGISGKFPKSDNTNEFWKNLVEGKELVSFYSDNELRKQGLKEEQIQNPNFVKADSLLDDPGSFDYKFFGYSRHEAAVMDPQIRNLHEQVWLALEDASYDPFGYSGKIGAFLTASDNINWRAYNLLSKNDKINMFFLNQISNKNFISTLISYNLNLRGPSYYVDTACSSSLVSVHMACRSLLLKECSIAIAGGARIESTTGSGYMHQEGMINSKDGHCKAFDKEATGTITGEGVGIVILKKLEDAVRDNDNIYGIIRASAVNNDGDRKVGFTAPSIKGQSECIKMAHTFADTPSETISYIETHGTGTKLGDPIEIEALNKAFGYNKNHRCAIGSVKTNMGHLDTTAGIAGLIKATLALKNKKIPPSLHFIEANPEINFASGPFYVNKELTDWKRNGNIPLRAGVSSFGIGGTNAHIILQEYIKDTKPSVEEEFQLIGFSAKSSTSVNTYHEELLKFLKKNPKLSIADIAYTLNHRRKQFKHHRFLVSKSTSDLIKTLEKQDSEQLFSGVYQKKSKIVFMCTGSGPQYINMCKGLYERNAYFKEILDKGLQHLKRITGVDFFNIVYNDLDPKDPNNQINKNEYTQPIVFVYEYAIAKLLMKWEISPNTLIGHSTGEYVAACIAGVFSYETAISLVVQRARFMSQSPKGSMLSISLSDREVNKLLIENTTIAAINSPESCVVSGTEEAINELFDTLQQKEISCSKLRISLAAHSFLMDTVLDGFKKELEKIDFNEPEIPFISNLTGKYITKEEACSVEYWLNHLRYTVRFSEGLTHLLQDKENVFIEIGPGNALTTMFQQHEKVNIHNNPVINLIRHPRKEIDDQQFLLERIGELSLMGIKVNWDQYYEGNLPQKISLPGYAFAKTNLPARVNLMKSLGNNSGITSYQFDNVLLEESAEEAMDYLDDMIDDDRVGLLNIYVEPTTEVEKELVKIWEDFFNRKQIGIQDDFFALGGNSLKGLTMLKLIEKTFETNISIKDFYAKPNIKELASEISLALQVRKLTNVSESANVIKI